MATIEEQLQQYKDQLDQYSKPIAPPTGSPDDGTRPSWTGLLGRAVAGGQSPGYRLRGSEADTAGNKALLNFGINMLLASGPAPVRPDLLSAAATGLQGAQQSLDVDQRRAQAAAVAQYGAAREQRQDQLAALKEALPLLQLQRDQAALTALKGGTTSTAGAPGGGAPGAGDGFTGDKEKDRALIVQRESHGDPTAMNYVAKADPTAWDRGATATGKYQFVTSTWQEGMKLAGIDPSKYARAMDAPESVQDQVFDAVYAKHGNKPWQKGARDWVKDENGRYQLATVRPSGGAPAAPGTPAPYQVATAGNAVPPPPGGAPGAPGATVPRETQVRGADGVVRTVVRPVPATASPARTGSVEPETGLPVASGPAAAPAPVVAPGAAPVAPTPAPAMATPPPFQMRPLTPTEQAATSYDLPPDMAAEIARDKANAPDVASFRAAEDKERAAKLARRNAADTERLRIEASERTAHNAQWQEQQKQRNAIEAERIKQEATAAAALKLEDQKAAAAERLEGIKSDNQNKVDDRKRFSIERDGARTAIDSLQTLQILSDAAGKQTPLEGLVLPGGQTGRDLMTRLGMGTEAAREKWGAQYAFNAAKNQMIIELRKGVSMGALSDRDMSFLQGMGPDLMNDPATRREMIALLENANQHKRAYLDKVEELHDEGKGLSWAKAKIAADKSMPKIIPDLPAGYNDLTPDAQRLWKQQHFRPGQVIRGTDGTLMLYRPQPQQ